jgi:outer membrane protein assembly factor BamE
MRKLPLLATLVVAMAAATAGCGILYKQPIYQGNLIDKAAADQLQVGMSMQQVQTLLGSPSIADPFHHDRWDYTASERTDRAGHIEIKNFTVYFDNGAVSKWEGDYFPEQDAELARSTVRRFGPNLSRDKKKKGQ